jgi:cell division protein FtsW (lipid II flippase)
MIRFLPESHTDFVVSVDWPAIALGLGLMVLLSFIVIWLLRATRRSDSGGDAER